MRVASFDTRIKAKWVKLFGYAAGRIEKALIEKGGALAAPAGLFIVKGTKGPLEEGEEERAAAWARGILEGGG
jgi:flavodoxin I